jgi:midasin
MLHFMFHVIDLITRICAAALRSSMPYTTGKPAVVQALGKVVGVQVTRINLSASTTVEQLFGSIVPGISSDGTSRVFKWQEGTLTTAVKAGHWILLDEINLASKGVLQCIAPLLERSAANFAIPNTDEVVDVTHYKVFATMNSRNIGGGRAAATAATVNTELIYCCSKLKG